MERFKTYWPLLRPRTIPWSRTLKNLYPEKYASEKSAPWKICILENVDPEKSAPWKTCILNNLHLQKSAHWKSDTEMSDTEMSDFRELCFVQAMRNVIYCLKICALRGI